MLILLLPVSFIGATLTLRISFADLDLRHVLLRATAVWAIITALILEGLSLASSVTQAGLSIVWAAVTLLAWFRPIRLRLDERKWAPLPLIRLPTDSYVRTAIVLIALVAFVILAVGLLSPPNTWDSLTTHMSRVAHWEQARSLRHYATGIELQNLYPPGPSLLVLQGYVLSGSDRFANLTDWSAMLMSVIGVSLISKRLGAGQRGQVLASLFAATLPMGIAQASSTMTDYLVALWLTCLAAEVIQPDQRRIGVTRTLFIGACAGLSVLTKPTSYAYLAPFAGYLVFGYLRRRHLKRLLRDSVLVGACVIAINLGYFSRNLGTYATPIGPRERIAIHSNEFMNLKVAASNVLRNASLHAGTPSAATNERLYWILAAAHAKLDLSMTDPRTSMERDFQVYEPLTDENRAGNTVHAVLILIFFPMTLMRSRFREVRITYALMAISAFLTLSLMIKFTVFASRYHLPFFVLSAPLIGTVASELRWRILPWGLSGIMLLTSWPWLLSIENRPFIPAAGSSLSILTTPRDDLYLPSRLGTIYQQVAARIKGANCHSVGIMISGSMPEYPFWVFMGAPRRGLRIEWIIGEDTPSSAYRPVGFRPCAVICQQCPDEWTSVRGLPLEYEQGGYRLYMLDA